MGCMRKLHELERLDIIGQPGLQFPSHITDDKRRRLIGQTMDAKCVAAIGEATIAYLDSDCIPVAMRTALDIRVTHNGHCISKGLLHLPSRQNQAIPQQQTAGAQEHCACGSYRLRREGGARNVTRWQHVLLWFH
jgi:hypothetical protein